ncbi:MAG TPA: GAF domain-containing sensor histidine kinase [Candidatus Limnocylindrales bacterium]|nr:GAF domain-containing sensor histidine kinase [Candidatus Limnocylindrales bacterium]
MTSPARPSARPAEPFPLVAALDALERWQREPSDERLVALRETLDGVLATAGARGLVLEICAPPLTTLEVGAGTLATIPPQDGRAGLATVSLGSHEGPRTLGRLYLDAPEEAVGPILAGMEFVVDAAWSRAEVLGRAQRMAALEAATRAVAAELDIDRVLGVIVDRVRELVGARFAALGIADGRGRIERFITSGISPEGRAAIGAVPRGHGLLGLIISGGQTVNARDIAKHPARYGFPAHHPVMTSFLGAPVMVKGRSAGNLYLSDKPDDEPFNDDDERLVEMFAVHAGIAIENARLHDQVQRLAVVEERERIGKDLHDGIIQAIYAVGLSLEDVPELVEDEDGRQDAVARVDRAIDALNLVIADIRSYILRLRPAMGGPEDPVEALARLGEELGMNAVIDLDVDLEGGADRMRALPPDRRSDLLFIAREALSNVARHAGATRTALVLAEDDDLLVLCIEDNGRGFDPAKVPGPDAFGRHQGLGNMRDRATGLGGTFAIERPDGPGTRIIVRVPAPTSTGTSERPNAATGER